MAEAGAGPTDCVVCVFWNAMNRIGLIAGALLSVLAAGCNRRGTACTANPPVKGALRVVTANVRKGAPAAEIIATLEGLGADVILLQEVDRGTYRANGENQPGLIAEALGMNHHFVSTHKADGGVTGVMILSRHELAETGCVEASGCLRPAAFATVNVDGVALRVYSAHLAAIWKPLSARHVDNAYAVRRKQARRLREHADQWTGPMILAGDMNALVASETYDILAAGLTDCARRLGQAEPTIPADLPLVRYDYVFASEQVTPVDMTTVRTRSDHLMVVADVKISR